MCANRDVLEEFIQIYQNETCLWNVKNKDYHNRDKRNAAYCKLIEKLKEIEPNADRDQVTKKINSFRTAFKKEEHKVAESLKSGAGVDEIYKPKLWYYDQLSFLKDQCIPRSSRSSMSDHDEYEMPTTTPTEPFNAEPAEPAEPTEPTERTETEAAEPTVMPTEPIREAVESTSISVNNRPQSRPPKKKADTIVNDVLMSVQNHFKRPAIREDRYDIFAKNIAIKMRELSKNQRIIAEKIINDTLFEAELGNLTLSHKLCNDNHTQQLRIHQQPQHLRSPIDWSTSSTSSNYAYSPSTPVPPVSATNSTQGIVITQQPLEVNEQQGYEQQESNSVQLSIPDLNAANYFTNFRL